MAGVGACASGAGGMVGGRRGGGVFRTVSFFGSFISAMAIKYVFPKKAGNVSLRQNRICQSPISQASRS
jgi:hypothetical protein